MTQSRSEETRTRVLDAARELLMEKGISEVSLKDIRERSGISNGSIFHHFGSKDGVVAQVFVAERTDYLSHVARAVLAFDGDPCDAFGEGARAAIEYQMRDPQRFMRLILNFTDSEWMNQNKQVWVGLADQVQQPVVEWAMPHFASGKLPMLPPPFFQAFMFGGTERLLSNYLTGRLEQDPRELADKMATFVSSGLKQLRDASSAPT